MTAGSRFEHQVALVTGGAGAIGAAAVVRFLSEGAQVMIADRDGQRVAQLVAVLRAEGRAVAGVVADVGEEVGAALAVDATVAEFGQLDVVFNNAGISGLVAPLQEWPVAAWDEIVRVNLRGIFLVMRQSLRAMIAARTGGAIVNMSSSMAGWDVLSGAAGYAATKHGVLGLTRVAALDAARHGIRINAVCPGVIETTLGVPSAGDAAAQQAATQRFANRTPLRRIGQPADVAALVAFLASSDAAHVTGAGWLIDGGQTMQSWSNAPDTDAYPSVT